MIAGTERGLLLTCLWYIREVDPQTLLLTGLTRDGVYLVEGGEVTGAVNNFRLNESPVDLLRPARRVGGPSCCLPREWSDYFTRTAMPALRIPDFNMSTVSAGVLTRGGRRLPGDPDVRHKLVPGSRAGCASARRSPPLPCALPRRRPARPSSRQPISANPPLKITPRCPGPPDTHDEASACQ